MPWSATAIAPARPRKTSTPRPTSARTCAAHSCAAHKSGRMVRAGFVDVLLAGNAPAVHDAELALLNTSLGVDLDAGTPVSGGHRHHMRAINIVNRAGGIRAAVESGVL